MEAVKLILRQHFPRPYKFLFNCKEKIRHAAQIFIRRRGSIKKFSAKKLMQRYQLKQKLAKRLVILSGMEEFHLALTTPSKILNEKCDPHLIVMLVVSALRIDPRVEREARALAATGYRVVVVCPDLSIPNLREQPLDWGKNIEFDILDVESASYTNELPWLQGKALLEAALAYKPLAFHCHDLSTTLIGLAAARQVGTKCVCDLHEWYSENVSWNHWKERWVPHPKIKRKIYQAAEALVMARANEVITVCDSIANELVINYPGPKRKVHVIRNIPSLSASAAQFPSLRDELSITAEKLILLWQGGTGPTRLLEPVIHSLIYAKNVVLVIRGPSLEYYGAGYLEEAQRAQVADRLHLLPPVKSADVVVAAHGADLGVWTLPKFCKNFYYALPNKLFEYLAAGLPVVCANFPEVRAIVERYAVGVVFNPYDPKSIAAALSKFNDLAFREKCRQNIPQALADMKSDQEWNKLVTIYNQLRA